jgi:WD40 repeat protein
MVQRNNAMAHDRAGRRWAVVERERAQAVVWDLEKPDAKIRLPHGDIQNIAVSPDGRWVATGTAFGRDTRVWDAETGALLKVLTDEGDAQVAFSPDGRRLAAGGPAAVVLWDTATWQPVLTLPMPKMARPRVAFSPDGRRLTATAGPGGMAVWEAGEDGDELAQ